MCIPSRSDRLNGNQYHKESVDEMVNILTEDKFKKKMVLVLAGYELQMQHMLAVNPGLKSRVTGTIHFADFDAADAVELLQLKLAEEDLRVAPDVALLPLAEQLVRAPGWANGRDVNTWAETTFRQVAMGVSSSAQSELDVVTHEHLRNALDELLKHKVKLPDAPSKQPADELPVVTMEGAAPPPAPLITEAMVVTVDEEEQCQECQADGDDDIYAALQTTCKDLGYDASHEKRVELKGLLEGVQGGEKFPCDIMDALKETTRKGEPEIDKALRPQLAPVIASFTAAIKEEEARRAEIARLEAEAKAEEAQKLIQEEARMQARLQSMGVCPAGFAWHREGPGWRCNGGAHYVDNLH